MNMAYFMTLAALDLAAAIWIKMNVERNDLGIVKQCEA
jgi:hypothetical protein